VLSDWRAREKAFSRVSAELFTARMSIYTSFSASLSTRLAIHLGMGGFSRSGFPANVTQIV
jgi:hypothetical protein